MSDPDLKLYHFPKACSRVSVCALEMAELPYSIEVVNLLKRAQLDPAYQALSPFGKVPVMLVDGQPLLENTGIISLVAALRPTAGVFPANPSPRMVGEIASGMSLCVGTLHPLVRGLAHPERVTSGEGEPVKVKSRELLRKAFDYVERRLEEREWWLGQHSIIDVYLDWIVLVAQYGGFSVDSYPRLRGLETRLAAMPGYRKMQEKEQSLWALYAA
jgi:glutathione S-transferase